MATESPTPSFIGRLFQQTMNTEEVENPIKMEEQDEKEEERGERSITMSDTTENIQYLRTQLRATSIGNAIKTAPRVEASDESESDEEESRTSKK
jgi:hypothetical protein